MQEMRAKKEARTIPTARAARLVRTMIAVRAEQTVPHHVIAASHVKGEDQILCAGRDNSGDQ